MQEARRSRSLHVAPNGAPGSARGGGWGGLVRPRPLASFKPSQLRALAVQALLVRAAAVSPLHSALRATVLRTRLLLRFTLYRSPPLLSAERGFLSPPPLYQEGGALPDNETSCSTLKLWCHSHQKQKAPYCVECFSSRWQVGARSFICVRLAWEHSTCFTSSV